MTGNHHPVFVTTMPVETAWQLYQISSSLSDEVQDGLGDERVALAVLASIAAEQELPTAERMMEMAPVHSSFTGTAFDCC